MLLTQLQRLPSTFSFTEASRVLPELLPLRDILYDLMEREIKESLPGTALFFIGDNS